MKLTRFLAFVLVLLLIAPAVLAADGAALFKSKCAMCHAENGGGDTPMGKKLGIKSLSSPDIQKKTDADLTAVVKNGKGKMPAFSARMTADEITAVVAHIRTFKK